MVSGKECPTVTGSLRLFEVGNRNYEDSNHGHARRCSRYSPIYIGLLSTFRFLCCDWDSEPWLAAGAVSRVAPWRCSFVSGNRGPSTLSLPRACRKISVGSVVLLVLAGMIVIGVSLFPQVIAVVLADVFS